MKERKFLTSTLFIAAAAMGFGVLSARAEIVDFNDGATSITLSDGDIVVCTETTNTPSTNWAGKTFVISGNTITSETWGTEGHQGSWIAWANQPTFTASLGASGDDNAVKIEGSGFLGITLKDDNGSNAATLDMTNVDASSFTGQISVVNKGVDRITVSLKGDWSGTEYVFGGVTDEWSGTTTASGGYWCLSDISGGTVTQTTTEGPLFSRGWTTDSLNTNVKDDDVLALQGDTTFAGITGVSKDYAIGGLNVSGREYITVSSEGTALTLAGTGSYEFYGTVGGNYDGSVTRASIVMNSSDGSGSQTFGGTNYLQDVTVTAGTLALDGTTSIAGSVSVASGSTLELGGEITLAGAISNSGTVIVDSDVVFVLDNLIGTEDGSGTTYVIISNVDSGTITGWSDLDYSNFSVGGTTLTYGRQITFGTDGTITYNEDGAAQNLVWAGDANSTTWTNNSSVTNWTNGSNSDYFASGDSVTFDDTASSKNVTIGEAVKAGSITISADYTFTFTDGGSVSSDSWTIGSTLTLAGEGTVKFGSGTIDVSKIANAEDSNVTLEFVAGTFNSSSVTSTTNIQFSSSATTLTNDIVFSGSGAVAIGLESGTSIEISGKVTSGENVTIYRAANSGSGGDVLTFSGEVDIQGGYDAYRGMTKFSGGGYIGTITLHDHNYTDGVTFSGASDGTEKNYTVGTITIAGSSNTGTVSFAVDSGATVDVGTFTASWGFGSITVDGTLNVSGTMNLATGNAGSGRNVISGSGTLNVGTLNVGNVGSYTFSGLKLNIGSGGITTANNYTLTFGDGLTVGVYAGDNENKAWSSSANITLSGSVTFNPLAGESIALSGTISGSNGTLIKNGEGTLTLSGSTTLGGLTVSAGTLSVATDGELSLSGTVTLASSISNSGTITISSSTSFTIGSLTMGTDESSGKDYYIIIDGSSGGGSVSFSGSISDFTLSSGGSLDGWSVYVDDGYLVIHNGEPPQELTWAGTDDGHEWNATQSNTIWTNNDAPGESVAFTTGSNVTFDDTAENKNVELGEDIEAGSITVTGTGYELSGEYKLTATELILADTDTDSGDHTFTIAEGTTVEVGSFTEDVGQMNLVVNGELSATSMHIDSSENEVISGSGSLKVNSFTYDAAQGSSLTISVANASFSTLYEQPYESDDNSGDYRTLIIGSEDGNIPEGAEHSTEVAVGTTFVLAGKSEIQVNKNSELSIGSLIDSSEYDTKISGDGSLLANYVTFGGSGKVTISIAMFDVGDITFSNSGKLTISSSTYFLAYTATFSNSGEITIAEGANVIIGEATSTVDHTITVEEGATFTVGSLDRTQNKLDLVVNGTMNVEKGLKVDEYYTGSTSGLLSFGDSTDASKTSYAQTLSGSGTVNAYGLETNLSSGSLTISVANLNIGAGGITEYGNSGIHIAGTTIGLYDTTKLTLSVPLTIDSAGATFKTNEGEELTLSGAITGNGMVTKDGEGTLILAGTGSTLTSGLTVLDGTLSVAANASLTIGGTVDLSSAIQNSGSITIADSTSFVMDNLSAIYDAENKRLYYEVVTGSGDSASVTLNEGISFTLGDGSLDGWTAYADAGGNLYVYSEEITSLTWVGTTETSINWTTNTSIRDWTPDGGTTKTYFFEGANVIFDTIGASGISSEVNITTDIKAGSITVNDEYSFATGVTDGVVVKTSGLEFGENGKLTIGDDVTVQIVGDKPLTGFSVDGTIVGTGTLQLELSDSDYSATVNLGAENEFAGTVYITAGNFTLNGSDIGNGTYRLGDGVNMQVTSSGVEVGNNFILEGTSQVHVNSSDSLTINGSITGVAGEDDDGNTVMGGTFDRQGAGSLTISGNVDIGTFIIDTSGSDATSSTTFSGESVTIGKLDIAYSDSVVFTNSGVNIGTIVFGEGETGTIEFKNGGTVGEIDYTERLGSGTIIVSSGTLNVGTIVDTFSGEAANAPMVNLQVGEGAVLHAGTITIAPGGAGSYYSKISGTEEGVAGTVIVDNFIVGSTVTGSGGASIEVSDVTLIVGSLSYGIAGNGSNYNLFLNNATLGFTDNTEIKSTTGTNDTSRFVLGSFAGNSTDTGSNTTTTINTSRYDVDSGDFTSAGVTVTISQVIYGAGELEVTGVGKLVLAAANDYSGGTTIASGATVVAQNASALGSGDVTVNGTLQVDTHLTVSNGSVEFSSSASLIVSQQIFADAEVDPDTTTAEAVAVITANTISFGSVALSEGYVTELVSDYITVQSGDYWVTGWYYYEGTLYACVIPEPELFSIFFGIGAVGLVATRRRKRRVA